MTYDFTRPQIEACKRDITALLELHHALSAAEINRLLSYGEAPTLPRKEITSIALSEMGKELVYRGGKHRLAAKCVAA